MSRSAVTIEQISKLIEDPERLTIEQVALRLGIKPSTFMRKMKKASKAEA